MPDYFTHGVGAEIIYERLENKYKNMLGPKPLYLLGAQGGDVFFAYDAKPTKTNLGRILHAKNPIFIFGKLAGGNKTYAAGFATHYAFDCTLHPYVYAYESTKKSPLAHSGFENDLGLYISRKYALRRKIIPLEQVLACTGPVYDSVKRIEPQITLTGTERCLKRHFAYTKFLYRAKRQDYKCGYDFKNLDADIERSVELGLAAVKCVLDGRIDPDVFGKEFLQK